jgi:hypothetical protein
LLPACVYACSHAPVNRVRTAPRATELLDVPDTFVLETMRTPTFEPQVQQQQQPRQHQHQHPQQPPEQQQQEEEEERVWYQGRELHRWRFREGRDPEGLRHFCPELPLLVLRSPDAEALEWRQRAGASQVLGAVRVASDDLGVTTAVVRHDSHSGDVFFFGAGLAKELDRKHGGFLRGAQAELARK